MSVSTSFRAAFSIELLSVETSTSFVAAAGVSVCGKTAKPPANNNITTTNLNAPESEMFSDFSIAWDVIGSEIIAAKNSKIAPIMLFSNNAPINIKIKNIPKSQRTIKLIVNFLVLLLSVVSSNF